MGNHRVKVFDFVVDSVMKKQMMSGYIDSWSDDASEQMKIAVDSHVLGTVYADAHAKNQGATAGLISNNINLGATAAPFQLTKTTVLDFIVDVGTVLDEQNIPETGRWFVIPAWVCGLIKKSDLKDASLAGDGTSIMRNGRMGMIDRFTLYNSNSIATQVDGPDTVYNLIAGHKAGLTFASQMTEMDTLKSETTFGEIVRGLNVYGFEVINNTAIVRGYVKK